MIEKEKQFFFFQKFVFFLANILFYILMIFWRFKTNAHLWFCHQLLKKLLEESEGMETKKIMISGQFFSKRLYILKQYQLKQMFLNFWQYLWNYTAFLLKFRHTFQTCRRCNAVTPGVLLDIYLHVHKILMFKSDGILSYINQIKFYLTW